VFLGSGKQARETSWGASASNTPHVPSAIYAQPAVRFFLMGALYFSCRLVSIFVERRLPAER
jgi:hypothetical protein